MILKSTIRCHRGGNRNPWLELSMKIHRVYVLGAVGQEGYYAVTNSLGFCCIYSIYN